MGRRLLVAVSLSVLATGIALVSPAAPAGAATASELADVVKAGADIYCKLTGHLHGWVVSQGNTIIGVGCYGRPTAPTLRAGLPNRPLTMGRVDTTPATVGRGHRPAPGAVQRWAAPSPSQS